MSSGTKLTRVTTLEFISTVEDGRSSYPGVRHVGEELLDNRLECHNGWTWRMVGALEEK